MALSGTATFNLTVNDVIQEAYDRIGGDPILGYDVRSSRRSLNILFSDWANRGYNQWTVEEKDSSALIIQYEDGVKVWPSKYANMNMCVRLVRNLT